MKTKTLVLITGLLLTAGTLAQAAEGNAESWNVSGKVFESKAQAIRYVMTLGKPVTIQHSHCEILTNKLTFKACPKNKQNSFDNQQFVGLKVSE